MEQKQTNSIEAEIDELKNLLAYVANNQISDFLAEANTAETAAELAYLIPIIQDKLTKIAKTYPLCRDDTFAALPDALRKNAVELKASWKCESTTLSELVTTIYTLLDMSTQRCIRLETIIAYQSINDHSTTLVVTMEQGVTAIDNINKVLERVTQFVSFAISSNRTPPLDPDTQKNIRKIFEYCEKMKKTFDQLIIGYQTSVVSEKEALVACVIKIARMMQDHQEQFEMNFPYLMDSLEIIYDALSAIARRLKPPHNFVTTTILSNSKKYTPHQNDLLTTLQILKKMIALTQKNVAVYIAWLCSQSDFLTDAEMCTAVDQNSQFLGLHEKTMAALENTLALVTPYNHSIDKKIGEDFEHFLKRLPKNANKIELVALTELMGSIFERLEQTKQWCIDQSTQQTKTPESGSPRLHYFKFFCTPKEQPSDGFHTLSKNETGYRHLAHFYLICKHWPVPSKSTNLPENAINLIFWWALKFSTDEDKNRFYTGRTGGLSVKLIEYPLTLTDKEKPSPSVSSCVSKFFTLVQPVIEKKPENEWSRHDVIIANAANNIG